MISDERNLFPNIFISLSQFETPVVVARRLARRQRKKRKKQFWSKSIKYSAHCESKTSAAAAILSRRGSFVLY